MIKTTMIEAIHFKLGKILSLKSLKIDFSRNYQTTSFSWWKIDLFKMPNSAETSLRPQQV